MIFERGRSFYSRHGQEVGDYFLDSLFCRYRLVVIVYRVLKGRWEEMDYIAERAPQGWRAEHDQRVQY